MINASRYFFIKSKKYCTWIYFTSDEIKIKRYIFSFVLGVDVEESCINALTLTFIFWKEAKMQLCMYDMKNIKNEKYEK